MLDNSPTIHNKLSSLIEGQVPDFIQADHPIFVQFLKSYYKFLESAELKLTVDIDSLLGEENTATFIVDETKGEKIILEKGAGSTGKFINGETITGSTSKATATVHVEDTSNGRIFISANQQFIEGETIVGATSTSQATIVSYRGNPVQNIQQLMEYASPDNTIDAMLENFRNMFMNVIPSSLASGVSKRNLVKAIRDLYTAKGTSEGHKFFLRLLLDDDATIKYPEESMLRVSGGKWNDPQIIRTTIPPNTSPSDFIGQKITGITSGATAIIVGSVGLVQGGISFAEYELDPNSITDGVSAFVAGETVNVISNVNDFIYSFTIKNIITGTTITDGGILHTVGETITTDSSIGNGLASFEVANIGRGSLDNVIIDDAGTGYAEGDTLVFTASQSDVPTSAVAKVSVISGMLRLEDGTASNSGTDGGQILIDQGVTAIRQDTQFQLESGTSGFDSTPYNRIILEDSSGIGVDADALIYESFHDHIYVPEDFVVTDGIILESDTTGSSGTNDSDHKGIRKIELVDGGAGYSELPVVTVTTSGGSGAKLLASTNNIGAAEDLEVTDAGYEYDTVPDPIFKVHLIVKDVSGTFSTGDALTSHAGTVFSYNSSTQILTVTPTQASNSNIILETGSDLLLEDGNLIIREEVFADGETRTVTTSGASATIAKVNVANGTALNGVISTKSGAYPFDRLNLLGESNIRLQDSYYYQQFSYEINVGASLSDYVNQLRRAVHPSGFNVFGKVTIATKVAAGISILTGKDIPDYTGDTDTFTPELASLFTTVFDNYLVSRRLGTTDDGTSLYSNAGNVKQFVESNTSHNYNILLDGTDGSETDAGSNLLLEDGFQIIREEIGEILIDDDVAFNANKRDLTLSKHMDVIISVEPRNRSNPNALKFLNTFPFHTNSGRVDVETATHEQGFSATFDDGDVTANVNGTTSSTTALVVDGNAGGTIVTGMTVTGSGISGVVTVQTVTDQNTLVLSSAQSLTNDVALTFKSVTRFDDNTAPPSFDIGPQVNRGFMAITNDYSNYSSVANLVQNANDYILLEDSSDTSSGPSFNQFGSIAFTDIFQYNGFRQEEGTTTNPNDEAESIILEDGNILLLEDDEQTESRLMFPDSIWTHSKEKSFTLSSVVMIT